MRNLQPVNKAAIVLQTSVPESAKRATRSSSVHVPTVYENEFPLPGFVEETLERFVTKLPTRGSVVQDSQVILRARKALAVIDEMLAAIAPKIQRGVAISTADVVSILQAVKVGLSTMMQVDVPTFDNLKVRPPVNKPTFDEANITDTDSEYCEDGYDSEEQLDMLDEPVIRRAERTDRAPLTAKP